MLIKLISDAVGTLATLILQFVFQIYLSITDFSLNPNDYTIYIPGANQLGTIMVAIGWILLIGTFLSEIVSSLSAPIFGKETKISPLQLVLKFIIYCIIFWSSQELVKYFMEYVANPIFISWKNFVNGWHNGMLSSIINFVFNDLYSTINVIDIENWVKSLMSFSWLWALIFSVIIGYNVFMAAFNMVERFLCLMIYYYMAPVAIALGFSDERSEMCKQYFMTMIAQLLAIGLNYTIFALGMIKITEFSDLHGTGFLSGSLKNFVIATVLFSIAKNSEKILNQFNLRSLPTMDSARSFAMGAAGAMRAFMTPMRAYRTATGYRDMVSDLSTVKDRRKAYAAKGVVDSAFALKNDKQGILPTVKYDANKKKVSVDSQKLSEEDLKTMAVMDGVVSPGGKTHEEKQKNKIAFEAYKQRYNQAHAEKIQAAQNFQNAVNGNGTMTVDDLNKAFNLNEQLNKGCSDKNPNFKLDESEPVLIDSEGNLHFHATTKTKDGFNELKEFAINPNQTMANGLIVDNKKFSSKAMDMEDGLNQMLEVTPAGNRIDFASSAFGMNQKDAHGVLRSNALGLSTENLGAGKYQLSIDDLNDRGDLENTLGGRAVSAVYDNDSGICVAKVQIPDKNAENGFSEQYFALMSKENEAFTNKEAGKELGNTGTVFEQKSAMREIGNNQIAIPITPAPFDSSDSHFDQERSDNWCRFTNQEKIHDEAGVENASLTNLHTYSDNRATVEKDLIKENIKEMEKLDNYKQVWQQIKTSQHIEEDQDMQNACDVALDYLNERIEKLSDETDSRIKRNDENHAVNEKNKYDNIAYNEQKRKRNEQYADRHKKNQ